MISRTLTFVLNCQKVVPAPSRLSSVSGSRNLAKDTSRSTCPQPTRKYSQSIFDLIVLRNRLRTLQDHLCWHGTIDELVGGAHVRVDDSWGCYQKPEGEITMGILPLLQARNGNCCSVRNVVLFPTVSLKQRLLWHRQQQSV